MHFGKPSLEEGALAVGLVVDFGARPSVHAVLISNQLS